MITVLLCVFLSLFVLYNWLSVKPLRHIPGPAPLPIIGNITQINPKQVHKEITTLAKQYGGVYKLKFFGENIVVISGQKYIYEVLVTKGADFSGRPYSYRLALNTDNYQGVLFCDMSPVLIWRRKVMYNFIRQTGQGLMHIEDVTLSSIERFVGNLNEHINEPVDIHEKLFECLSEIMSILLVGEAMAKADILKFKKIVLSLSEVFNPGGTGILLDIFPSIRYFGFYAYQHILESKKIKKQIVGEWLKRDVHVGFVNSLQTLSDEEKGKYHVTETVVENMLYDFLEAGIITTYGTLTTLMNVLVHHTHVQRKLQEEVNKVRENESMLMMLFYSKFCYCLS